MDEKSVLLKRHGCSQGLTDEEIQEIAADCELVEVASGEVLYRAGEPLKFLYLVVQGRLKQTFHDPRGNEILRAYLVRGSQFGAVAAAQADPIPATVVAVEPSTLLKLDYDKFLHYLTKIPRFLLNFIQGVGDAFKEKMKIERVRSQPNVVMVVHDSPASRQLTTRLIDRLQELGEHPCVLTDDPSWETRGDVPHVLLVRGGNWLSDETVRAQIAQWSAHERVFIDVAATVERDRLIRGVKLADFVLACIQPDDWERCAHASGPKRMSHPSLHRIITCASSDTRPPPRLGRGSV